MEENEEAKGEDAEEEVSLSLWLCWFQILFIFQIKVYVELKTFKPDLYAAASINDTTAVLDYLSRGTPGTYIDTKTSWTVRFFALLG